MKRMRTRKARSLPARRKTMIEEPKVIISLQHYNKLLRELEVFKDQNRKSPERELLEVFQEGVPAMVRAIYQDDMSDYKLQQLLNLATTRSASHIFTLITSPNTKAWVQIQRK